MNNRSKAFEEFVDSRCDELLEKDPEHNKRNVNVLNCEMELKGSMPPELVPLFLKYEGELIGMITYDKSLIYKGAIKDKDDLF